MADNQVKHSVHRAQASRAQRSKSSKPAMSTRRLFHFPQVQGKVVEDVEFSTHSDYHNVSINFRDKTSLNLEIEASFTLGADYSDWKTGNQRVLRAWGPVRSLGLSAGVRQHRRSSPTQKKVK